MLGATVVLVVLPVAVIVLAFVVYRVTDSTEG
jgi:uncharacterized membrane protein YcjF (UPF0283 family)